MLKEWMNTPWAQEAHQASLNSLMEAARSGEQVHPAFASMAVELDEIDRVLLDQLREQRSGAGLLPQPHDARQDICRTKRSRARYRNPARFAYDDDHAAGRRL